jgi:hypothetical protein
LAHQAVAILETTEDAHTLHRARDLVATLSRQAELGTLPRKAELGASP